MCRWIIYYGDSIILSDLLITPNNSLLKQSEPERELYTPLAEQEISYDELKHKLRNHITNGDGYGIAWYRPDLNKLGSSCFKSTSPAWNDKNMLEICEGIESDLIMAHIRAASPGSVISRENCHPFKVGRYTFMHNGGVAAFSQARRGLRAQLRDDIESQILGTADSELCFGIFLNQLKNSVDLLPPKEVGEALHKAIQIIIAATKLVGGGASSLNFAVTDGFTVVTSRFRNCASEAPPALYLAHGAHFGFKDGEFHMKNDGMKDTIILSSEPLSKCPNEWKLVSPNHIVVVWGENHPLMKEKQPVEKANITRKLRQRPEGDSESEHGELTVIQFPIEFDDHVPFN